MSEGHQAARSTRGCGREFLKSFSLDDGSGIWIGHLLLRLLPVDMIYADPSAHLLRLQFQQRAPRAGCAECVSGEGAKEGHSMVEKTRRSRPSSQPPFPLSPGSPATRSIHFYSPGRASQRFLLPQPDVCVTLVESEKCSKALHGGSSYFDISVRLHIPWRSLHKLTKQSLHSKHPVSQLQWIASLTNRFRTH